MKIMNFISFIVLCGLVAIPALQGAQASDQELKQLAAIREVAAQVSAGPGAAITEADLQRALSLLPQNTVSVSNPTPTDAVVTVDNVIELAKDTAVETGYDLVKFTQNAIARCGNILTHGPTLRDALDGTRFAVSVAPATTLGYLLWPAKDCVGWVRRPRQLIALGAALYLLNHKSDIAQIFNQLRTLNQRVSMEGSETRRQMVKNFNLLAVLMQMNANNLHKQMEANQKQLIAAGEVVNNNVISLRADVGNNHRLALATIQDSAQQTRTEVGANIAADGDRTRALITAQQTTQTALRNDVTDVNNKLNGQLARLEQMQRNLATMMQLMALSETRKPSPHAAAGAGA